MMNTFAIIIVLALMLGLALELSGNLLNLRALTFDLPPALQGIYKPGDYRKSQEYIRATTRFGLLENIFTLTLLLAFWFSGGFNWFDRIIRGFDFAIIINGLLYIGLLLFAYSLLMLPFSIYHTFVIEQRFGFNKTTPRLFAVDQIKGYGLILILGGPLLAGIIALFQYAGAYAWLYCWAAVVTYLLLVQYVAPAWFAPLFNKFTPMPEGELKNAIFGYARSVKFPIKNVFIIDSSKRSAKSNAFFTGFGRNKRIALYDTLVSQHTVPEIVAVLAHEIGHYKKKHIIQGIVAGAMHAGLIFFLLSVFLGSPGLYQAFYMKIDSIYTGLLFFGLLYTPIELVLTIFMQMVSRKNEYEADRFAAQTINNPRILADALKKLAAANLSNLTPHPFYVILNYSHPPLLQRLLAINDIKRGSLAE